MKKSIAILGLAVGAGVLAIFLRWSRPAQVEHAPTSAERTQGVGPVPQNSEGPEAVASRPAGQNSPTPTGILAMMDESDPEFQALVANELDRFRALVRDEYTPIPEKMLEPVATALARARAAQLLFESRHLARVVPESSERTRVEIPAYYDDEGQSLMAYIDRHLVAALPDPAQVEDFWEYEVLKAFHYLGRHPQTLTFQRDPDLRRNGAVEVTSVIPMDDRGAEVKTDSLLRIDQLDSYAPYASVIPQ